jgi:four helix bundle protein
MTNKESKIGHFKDLRAWQEAHTLVLLVYKLTQNFPKEEVFGLTSQMRRCAVSISSNIAEGFGRNTYKDKANFYFISRGSITELENQTLVASDVGYLEAVDDSALQEQIVRVQAILNGLIKKTKTFTT